MFFNKKKDVVVGFQSQAPTYKKPAPMPPVKPAKKETTLSDIDDIMMDKM